MSSKDKKIVAKPASKTVAKPAAKPAAKSAAKSASKPAAKAAVKAKPEAKPAKVAAKAAVKAATKSAAKPAAKAAAKPAAKAVAKPVVKAVVQAQASKAATKPVAKAPASKPVTKLVVKAESAGDVVSKPVAKAAPKAPEKKESRPVSRSENKPMVAELAKAVAATRAPQPVAPPAPSHAMAEKKEVIKEKELSLDEAVLLQGGKKTLKTSFFSEVDDAEERANKKKYSAEAKGPEKPTAYSRRKSSLVEETPEELIERLAMELEEENMGIMREAEVQLCTKCGLNTISPEFRVDKDLGYCDECAEILRLGQTKEARKVDYQMSLMRKDAVASEGADEEAEEDIDMDEEDVEDLDED